MTEGDAVVEDANLQRVGHRRQVVRQRELRAVGVTDGGAPHARPRVALLHLVAHVAAHHDARRQIVPVEVQDDRRRIDHRRVLHRDREGQAFGIRQQLEFHPAIRAGHLE